MIKCELKKNKLATSTLLNFPDASYLKESHNDSTSEIHPIKANVPKTMFLDHSYTRPKLLTDGEISPTTFAGDTPTSWAAIKTLSLAV